MKTVMKKMFSLLLVAVLMVSALPFQASAAEFTVAFYDETGATCIRGVETVGGKIPASEFPYAAPKEGFDIKWVDNAGNAYTSETTITAVTRLQLTYVANSGHTHTWDAGTVVTPATCENAGNTLFTCTSCGATTNQYPDPLGHTGGTATCKDKPICSNCGQVYGAVDPTKHVNTEVRYAKAATCAAAGHTGDTYCLDCGNVAYGAAIPATGAHTWSAASCTTAKVCTVCNTTEGGAPGHSFPTACGVEQICSVCRTPNPAPINHTWVDANCTTPKTCSVCRKTEGGALGHTWDQTTKTCRICNVAYSTVTRYPVYYNVNVGGSSSVLVKSEGYEANTPMSTVLADLAMIKPQNPSYFARWYSLEGWYMEPSCTTRASGNITSGVTLYAKWVRNYEYNVYLKIYTNGNSSNLVRIEDMFEYAQDHVITLAEVQDAVRKHVKSNNNAPLTCYGPFLPEDWDIYLRDNHKLNIQEKTTVYNDRDTTLYVMVHNAQIGGSTSGTNGSKADSTNPKTGDMIMMPAAVLGLSASSLAVLYYLNKKKRVM